MKKYLRLPALLFFIPFVYIALLLEANYNAGLSLFIGLLFALAVGFYFQAAHQLKLWFFGNVCSTVVSLFLQSNHPEWSFFYQPFDPTTLVLALSLLFLVAQLIGVLWANMLQVSLAS